MDLELRIGRGPGIWTRGLTVPNRPNLVSSRSFGVLLVPRMRDTSVTSTGASRYAGAVRPKDERVAPLLRQAGAAQGILKLGLLRVVGEAR
jgi:hypothetical protein